MINVVNDRVQNHHNSHETTGNHVPDSLGNMGTGGNVDTVGNMGKTGNVDIVDAADIVDT